MPDVTCATCPFFRLADDVGDGFGECHQLFSANYNDRVDPGWWCSAHPLAPGQRERIAEMAMQGVLAGESAAGDYEEAEGVVVHAYEIADAMMAERRKPTP